MGNRVWDGTPRDGVNSRPGLKTTGEYSGLHRPGQQAPYARETHGDAAQERVNETARRQLNEGEDFDGHLQEWKVGGLQFWVGTHRDYGPMVFPQIKAFYPEHKIMVYHGADAREVLLGRSAFYLGLLPIEPTWQAFEQIFKGLRERIGVLPASGHEMLREISKQRTPTVSK